MAKKQASETTPTNNIEIKPNSTAIDNTATEPMWDKIFWISLAAVFILMTVMSFSYGISGDEVDMNEYGKQILKYFLSFGSDKSVFLSSDELNAAKIYNYNRDNVVQYYGGLFDLICAIINKVSPLEEYTTRHILNAWAGFLAIFFAAKLAVRSMNKQAGTIAIWLMFLSPFFLGHAMNNPKDIPFAAAYIMAIYFIIQLFDRLPSPSKKDYAWAILSIGAAINVRVGGILLLPYLVVFAGIIFIVKNYFQDEKVSLISFVKPIAITGILGYLAGSIFWPYGLQNPISNPLTALREMGNFKVNIRQTFEGAKVFSGDLPVSFLPISFGITNTFALLAGLALVVLFIWQYRKNKQAPVLYFIGFTALFPLLYIIYTKANVYHAWRHVLFIFPSMVVLATFGWNSIITYFEQKNVKLVGMGMLGFLLLEPTYFIATTFPNTITYHNQLVGGVQGAYNNYEVDYYYNSLKQSADWFKKNELPKYKNTDTIKIYSNAAHILTHYFENDKNVIVDYIRYPERNQKAWDYIIMHIALIPAEDIKTGNWLPPSTLFKAESQGKALSAVIKRPSTDDLKAFDLLNQNQPDAAIGYFDSYLKADPKNTSVLNTVANVLMQLGRIDSAAIYINNSYKADSSNMETKQLYGMMRLQKNDFGTAQTIFSQIIQENPQYARAYYFLGLAQLGAGNFQQALNNLNTASQDESMRQSCYKSMGDCYMKMGNQQEAMKLYQAAGLQ